MLLRRDKSDRRLREPDAFAVPEAEGPPAMFGLSKIASKPLALSSSGSSSPDAYTNVPLMRHQS